MQAPNKVSADFPRDGSEEMFRQHVSETALDGIDVDLTIGNVGSLEVFQSMIRDLTSR